MKDLPGQRVEQELQGEEEDRNANANGNIEKKNGCIASRCMYQDLPVEKYDTWETCDNCMRKH